MTKKRKFRKLRGYKIGIPVLFFIPLIVVAQLVPCDGPNCHLSDLGTMVNTIIDFLVKLALPLLAVMLAWGGFLLLFSGGDPGKITSGKKVLWASVIGFLLVMFAWLIVKTVLSMMGVS